MTSITLPLVVFDEQRAINRMSIAVALVRGRLTSKEWGREWLETTLRRYLREGDLTIANKAVEAADKEDDEIADAALRGVGAELQMPLLQRRDLAPGHLQVIAYFARVGERAPLKRKPGRYHWSDHWYRNIGICVLVHLACAEFDVQPTRNRESQCAGRQPSGCSLVAAALKRNRIILKEPTIQESIWLGLPGALVRRAIAEGAIEQVFSVPT